MDKVSVIKSISKPVDILGRQRNATPYDKVEKIFNYVTKPERPSYAFIAEIVCLNPATVERITAKIQKAGYEIGKLRHNYNSHGYYVDMSDLIGDL